MHEHYDIAFENYDIAKKVCAKYCARACDSAPSQIAGISLLVFWYIIFIIIIYFNHTINQIIERRLIQYGLFCN